MRLSKAIEVYLQQRDNQQKEHNTTRMEARVLDGFLATVGDLLLEEITREHVEKYFLLLRPGVKASSLNKYRQWLNLFFRRGLELHWPLNYEAMDGWHTVTEDEVEKLWVATAHWPIWLAKAEEHGAHVRAGLAVALYTGLRVSEIQLLRVKEVNMDRREIRVRRIKTHTIDVIAMPDELVEELTIWLDHYREVAGPFTETLWREAYLIPSASRAPSRKGGWGYWPDRPYNRLSKAIAAAKRAAGISGPGAAHVARRSSAQAVLERAEEEGHTNPIQIAGEHLGHRGDVRTTIAYLAVRPEQRALRTLMSGSFFGNADVDTALSAEMSNVIPLRRGVDREQPADTSVGDAARAEGNPVHPSSLAGDRAGGDVLGFGRGGRGLRVRRDAARGGGPAG